MLTDEQVILIRTAGMMDSHFAKLLRMTPQSINRARRGMTFKHITTPPDIAPRRVTHD